MLVQRIQLFKKKYWSNFFPQNIDLTFTYKKGGEAIRLRRCRLQISTIYQQAQLNFNSFLYLSRLFDDTGPTSSHHGAELPVIHRLQGQRNSKVLLTVDRTFNLPLWLCPLFPSVALGTTSTATEDSDEPQLQLQLQHAWSGRKIAVASFSN